MTTMDQVQEAINAITGIARQFTVTGLTWDRMTEDGVGAFYLFGEIVHAYMRDVHNEGDATANILDSLEMRELCQRVVRLATRRGPSHKVVVSERVDHRFVAILFDGVSNCRVLIG